MIRFAIILFLFLTLKVDADLVVTNYGAIPDKHDLTGVTTTSNSVSVVAGSSIFTQNDTNKWLLLAGVGTYHTSSHVCEDFISVITNVVNGTTVQVDHILQCTTNGAWGFYATNNKASFRACAADAIWPGLTNIVCPKTSAGSNYFLADYGLLTNGTPPFKGIDVYRAGLNFCSYDPGVTLTGNGMWKKIAGLCERGYTFSCEGGTLGSPGITNVAFPLMISNLICDGGLGPFGVGNINSSSPQPADPETGLGIDETHDVLVCLNGQNQWTTLIVTNSVWQHYRGEMAKDTTSAPQMFVTFNNVTAQDGNLTVLNNFAHGVNGCKILNQISGFEEYQSAQTNASYTINTLFSNVQTVSAIGGAVTGNEPPMLFSNNTCYVNTKSGIQLGFAAHVTVISNTITTMSGSSVAGINAGAGAQGSLNYNLDCKFIGNTFVSAGANGDMTCIINGIAWVLCGATNNVGPQGNYIFMQSGVTTAGTNTPFYLSGNTGGYLDGSSQTVGFLPVAMTNNNFSFRFGGDTGGGQLYYGYGWSHKLVGSGTSWFTQEGALIPAGAILQVLNNAGSTQTIYLSSAQTGTPVSLANGATQTFYWFGAWQTSPVPPVAASVYLLPFYNHQ